VRPFVVARALRGGLLADGTGAIVGALLGSPFPPAVYIGHPGWKAVGGRIGYSLATGVVIGIVCFLGLTALLLAVIPLVAILPILLYIGLVIGAQAFQATPPRHAPAIVLAILPNIAAWAQTLIDGALGAAGTSAEQIGMAKLGATGVVYHGMALLGGGAVLAGLILGAIALLLSTESSIGPLCSQPPAPCCRFLASSTARRWASAIRRRWRSAT